MNKALFEIEKLTVALQGIGKQLLDLRLTLDTLTRDYTAFPDFSALVHAPGMYFPSIRKAPKKPYWKSELVFLPKGRTVTRETQFAELNLLALAYDMAQQARNDPRRAFRS